LSIRLGKFTSVAGSWRRWTGPFPAVESQIHFVADVSRADILLYGWLEADRAIVLAHARPHSISPIYPQVLTGQEVGEDQEPLVVDTLTEGRPSQGGRRLIADGAPIIKQVYPLRRPGDKQVIAAFSVETNLLEHERHRRRRRVFQRALLQLQGMAQRAQLAGVADLNPFEEHDGIIVTDREEIIRYASGIATNLYRRIGYPGGLWAAAWVTKPATTTRYNSPAEFRCLERERRSGWAGVKKAIRCLIYPVTALSGVKLEESAEPIHVMLLGRDFTRNVSGSRNLEDSDDGGMHPGQNNSADIAAEQDAGEAMSGEAARYG
jgi:hypothetical protein